MLVPNVPFRRMRLLALALSPRGFLAFNENLNHFMLRPGSVPAIARHIAWRAANTLRWSRRTARDTDWSRVAGYAAATLAGRVGRSVGQASRPVQVHANIPAGTQPGVTVVIPSRTGKELLEAQLPGILAQAPGQIVVVDNGSTDATAEWLASTYPQVEVAHSAAPLSFARAVNRGISLARCRHVCLLNNDMLLEPGFFAALERAFQQVPDLFCATAQIRFPPGVRREETGKTVFAQSAPTDFPVRCDEPLPGEDGTWVLYGSGGCSLYDAAKLRELGNVDEVYEPAYVEDLDLGYRAWQRGWPSVYVAGAVVEHRHRATTTRYYTEDQLSRILEINYLRFVARAVSDAKVFRRLWSQAIRRLYLLEEPALVRRAGSPCGADLACPPSIPRRSSWLSPMAASASFPAVRRRANRASWWPALTCRSRCPTAAPYACTTSCGAPPRSSISCWSPSPNMPLRRPRRSWRSVPKWCWYAAPAATPCRSPAVPR